jgi:hypothetical protein
MRLQPTYCQNVYTKIHKTARKDLLICIHEEGDDKWQPIRWQKVYNEVIRADKFVEEDLLELLLQSCLKTLVKLLTSI